jgi:hypothetical protein
MLTGDPIEAIEQARSFLKKRSVEAYYEEIVLGALRLAAADAALGRLDDKRLENIHQTVSEIIEDLGSYKVPADVKESDDEALPKTNVVGIDARKPGPKIFCISGLGRLDACVALLLADFLKRRGMVATAAKAIAIENEAFEIICVCFLKDVTAARRDFTIRKLSRQAPSARVIVCLLGAPLGSDERGERPEAAPRSLPAVMEAIDNVGVGFNCHEN